jgi:hypothetical protein
MLLESMKYGAISRLSAEAVISRSLTVSVPEPHAYILTLDFQDL